MPPGARPQDGAVEAVSEWLLGFVASQNNGLGLAAIAGAAAIEYIFPPFPGDTITLFAAVLITAYHWSFALVFAAIMAGSLAGSMAAFALGVHLSRRRERAPGPSRARPPALDRLVERFRRHGPIYLILNRFLPGIRPLFFLAAGMSKMSAAAVLLYSALSAALWNLGLVALGALLGANFETLANYVARYTAVAFTLIAAVVAMWILRALYRKVRRARLSPAE